jgi:hypothetical protein
MFERELWEQTGLQPTGHPWLKPVRFEGTRQQHMADYPFFSVRGQDVHEVGVGPIHASVIEPGHFRFMCHGEQVHHLEIQLGYQHRGVERCCCSGRRWRWVRWSNRLPATPASPTPGATARPWRRWPA